MSNAQTKSKLAVAEGQRADHGVGHAGPVASELGQGRAAEVHELGVGQRQARPAVPAPLPDGGGLRRQFGDQRPVLNCSGENSFASDHKAS